MSEHGGGPRPDQPQPAAGRVLQPASDRPTEHRLGLPRHAAGLVQWRTNPAGPRPPGRLSGLALLRPEASGIGGPATEPALRSQPDVIAAEVLHDGQPQRPLLQDGDRPGFVLVLGQECSRVMQRGKALAESLYS